MGLNIQMPYIDQAGYAVVNIADAVSDYDALARHQMTDSSGASLVGFIHSGTGAAATDLQTRGRLSLFLSDYMTPNQKSDWIAGTMTVDMTSAFDAAQAAGITAKIGTIKYSGKLAIASPVVVGTSGYPINFVGEGAGTGCEVKALSAFTGGLFNILSGGVSGCVLTGFDSTTVGHSGIVLGNGTYFNQLITVYNITNGGGLYDVINSIHECDRLRISLITSYNSIGRAVIWIVSSAPPASLKIERCSMQNPTPNPVAGSAKKYGIYVNKTEEATIDSCIINRFDVNIFLGYDQKNWSPKISNIHIEERRDSVYSATAWTATTAHSLNDYTRTTAINCNGHFYICTVAGTTGSTEPTWPTTTGGTVVDGTVTWAECGSSIGISLGQNDNGVMENIWIDQTLVCINSISANSMRLIDSTHLQASQSFYLQVASQSTISLDNCSISGDIRLTGGSATTYWSARNTTITSDTVGDVPSVPQGYFSNQSALPIKAQVTSIIADATASLFGGSYSISCAAGNVTLTLPNAPTGTEYFVYRTDNSANTVTISPPYGWLGGGSLTLAYGENALIRMIAGGTSVKNKGA